MNVISCRKLTVGRLQSLVKYAMAKDAVVWPQRISTLRDESSLCSQIAIIPADLEFWDFFSAGTRCGFVFCKKSRNKESTTMMLSFSELSFLAHS